ncbi:MAG: hypothetical protein KDE09_21725 [Anaerolineales bacterium]|nr:hypothetical protein [Anaerolineales bacterium]MCB0020433.1 hypothetical protein [Anaerolineales bacterium]MCB0031440.1 hypothetical protein [Anaerolineales bacterium]MCB8958904.1 hypothetical protein [Ardenticatenales bacterium]
MIQPQTQTESYWVSNFALSDDDIEQIYNHFLAVGRPQSLAEVTRAVMASRVAAEKNEVQRMLSGRIVYQPQKSYSVGDDLVFPSFQFAQGKVTDVRPGTNPQYQTFNVITVEINKVPREFAADLAIAHPLNVDDGLLLEPTTEIDLDGLFAEFGPIVMSKVSAGLASNDEFVTLGNFWFVKGLMIEITVGHQHLAEAILEMNEGGPLPPEEILVHLDLDPSVSTEIQAFSLNYALLQDKRFDEVGSKGEVAWFLHRLEPKDVLEVPERLRYTPIPHDRALLNPQLLLLERELDDEWSSLESSPVMQPVTIMLTYPHRAAGTLPLGSRAQQLFPIGKAPRQRITFIDEETNDEIVAWVVREGRYVFGLADWYGQNNIPIGGFLSVKEGPRPGTVYLNYDRRRPQREWVRLATAVDGRIKFELHRRSIGCGYDDLMIVGTDYVAAMDALFRQAEKRQRTIASLLAEIFPELANLSPQNTVHAKTLYSAINILRRVPPGPLFAELVRHPAFQPVGDHYWQFISSRWQKD